MKVLELFAGTRSIEKPFVARGHKTFSIEWDKKFEDIDLYADVGQVTAQGRFWRSNKPPRPVPPVHTTRINRKEERQQE